MPAALPAFAERLIDRVRRRRTWRDRLPRLHEDGRRSIGLEFILPSVLHVHTTSPMSREVFDTSGKPPRASQRSDFPMILALSIGAGMPSD
ncbi:hypothetical protein ACETK8_18710 [Brevundimonas staleyi]|uniref:Uncharacterized protein n=1 Tax=Brevundimonas staleyi TaxID=74326 RepID=A0ABW0FQW4_9CAUL